MNNISLITYFIVCPIVGLAGFVDSIAGGGGLISLPAYLIAGIPPVVASATNKLSAFMGASVSLFNYTRSGYVKLKLALPCCLIAVCFASLGAKVQTLIPEEILKVLMLILLPTTLIIILNKKSLEPPEGGIIEFTAREMLLSIMISAAIGFYDGIYGPGTGTFLLILFVQVIKMNIKEANGQAKAINFSTNCGALLFFLGSNRAIVPLGIAGGLCSMIGSYIGSKLFAKKGVNIAKPIMIVVMIVFIIKLLFEFTGLDVMILNLLKDI